MQKGIDAVVAVCKRALGHYDGILHVMNNIRVEQNGDSAKVHYYAISYYLRKGVEGGETLTNRGENTIDVIRTREGWKIECYRSSKIAWQEGNPKVGVNKADPATHKGDVGPRHHKRQFIRSELRYLAQSFRAKRADLCLHTSAKSGHRTDEMGLVGPCFPKGFRTTLLLDF